MNGNATRRSVKCPACGGPSVYGPDNPFRPFCSERCKTHDLGAWAAEQYRVPDHRPGPDAGEDADPPTASSAPH